MDINRPLQIPFGNGNIELDYSVAHYYVGYIANAIRYFEERAYKKSDLIMQIPLPLRHCLAQIMAGLYDKIPIASVFDHVDFFGVKCLPGYEARIVMYSPVQAFFEKNPIVIIDFTVRDGCCLRPVFRVVE